MTQTRMEQTHNHPPHQHRPRHTSLNSFTRDSRQLPSGPRAVEHKELCVHCET